MNDISYQKSDLNWLVQVGAYIQHHRLNQNRSQKEVADAAGLSRSTLSLLERGEPVAFLSLIRVLRALEKLEVLEAFSFQNEISPIAYAKLARKQRQRASRDSGYVSEPDDLGW